MFGAIKDIGKPGSAMRWLLHGVLFIGMLALLAFIQYHYEIGRYVSAPHPYLRQAWLPLLGFLVYVNIWLDSIYPLLIVRWIVVLFNIRLVVKSNKVCINNILTVNKLIAGTAETFNFLYI